MVFLDKYGWPVTRIKGRWFVNFMRLLIHTRKIVRKWEHKPTPDPNCCTPMKGESDGE